ncbi:MAG: hypothetical protein LBJ38_03810, partial [Oscillospiraceae bacterium]|nr:hypothetical protein [Oscillospiraceae bacterium]
MARKRVWILAVLGLGLLGSVLCLMMRSPREQTEFVANCGDKKIPTGLYVMYEMLDATEAVIKQIVKNSNEGVDAQGDLKEHLRDVIDGKVVEDLIVEKTKECVTRHVEIDRLFDELGLTLSAEAEKKLEAAELAYNRQKEQLEK